MLFQDVVDDEVENQVLLSSKFRCEAPCWLLRTWCIHWLRVR